MIKVYYFTDNTCYVKLNVQRIDKSGPSKLLNEYNECEMITYKQLRLEKKSWLSRTQISQIDVGINFMVCLLCSMLRENFIKKGEKTYCWLLR